VREHLSIDGERLLADLRELAEFGRTANGINRTEGREHLTEIGRRVLWEGAQRIEFRLP
jgi:hypothetical protein